MPSQCRSPSIHTPKVDGWVETVGRWWAGSSGKGLGRWQRRSEVLRVEVNEEKAAGGVSIGSKTEDWRRLLCDQMVANLTLGDRNGAKQGFDVRREKLVTRNCKGAAMKHLGSEVGGRHRRSVEVSYHRPRFPAAHHANDKRVDLCSEEGHSATSAQGLGTNIQGGKTKGGTNAVTAGSKGKGQIVGCDFRSPSRRMVDGKQRSRRWG